MEVNQVEISSGNSQRGKFFGKGCDVCDVAEREGTDDQVSEAKVTVVKLNCSTHFRLVQVFGMKAGLDRVGSPTVQAQQFVIVSVAYAYGSLILYVNQSAFEQSP